MKVVITIPAYNEEKTIADVISGIRQVMSKTKYSYKLLLVDDGSTDRTAEIAEKAGAIVFRNQTNKGLARTFGVEMRECLKLNADIIVHTDADGQYLAKDIPSLIKEVEAGNDIVLGSRFKGKIEEMSFLKTVGNKAFSKVISSITRTKISDAQTGFRAFTNEVAKSINIVSDFTYTQEQIIKAARMNFKIKEIPVYFAKRKDKSRLIKHPFEYALKAWINLFRIYRDYKPLKFFGIFGGTFFLAGFAIGLFILYTFFTKGFVGALPRVMLSVLFISIGVQIWLFGFLADMIRK